MFRHKPQVQEKGRSGRFEIERDGEVGYLEYALSPSVLQLLHTEIPKNLRGRGVASSLTEAALRWARDRGLKVDPVCPVVQKYLAKHPEYADFVVH